MSDTNTQTGADTVGPRRRYPVDMERLTQTQTGADTVGSRSSISDNTKCLDTNTQTAADTVGPRNSLSADTMYGTHA